LLQASPEAHGLFSKAVGMSGSPFGEPLTAVALARGEAEGLALQKALGAKSIEDLRDIGGDKIAAAPVVVLANACNAARLIALAPAPIQRVAGQLTLFPASSAAPRTVVCGRGYVLPEHDGKVVAGVSYDLTDDAIADDAMEPDGARHAANLRRAERLLPGITANVDMKSLRGEVGMRCVARDRLPMVGPMVDIDRARAIADTLSGAHASDMPRLPGLFCAIAFASRGLAWTAIAAECVASQLEGEPLPLEATLADAIDPGRFAVKRARRGTL